MQNNRQKDKSEFDKLMKHFNSIQLSTFRYNKHFETMLGIMVREEWAEWSKLALAANECERNIAKICDNMKSINVILFDADSQSVLEEKNSSIK